MPPEFLPPWPYIAHRDHSPTRPLLPPWISDGDTVYWWPCMMPHEWPELDSLSREAARDGKYCVAFDDGPFTLLVVRGEG